MRYYLIFFVFFFTSCDILKNKQKTKKDITQTESIKTQIKRAGDTLKIQIPNITYKDTTIVKTNYVNRTEARVTYDSSGNKTIECISAELDIFREEFRTLIDQTKEKDKVKESSFQSEIVIYIVIGVVLIFLFLIWRAEKKIDALMSLKK